MSLGLHEAYAFGLSLPVSTCDDIFSIANPEASVVSTVNKNRDVVKVVLHIILLLKYRKLFFVFHSNCNLGLAAKLLKSLSYKRDDKRER